MTSFFDFLLDFMVPQLEIKGRQVEGKLRQKARQDRTETREQEINSLHMIYEDTSQKRQGENLRETNPTPKRPKKDTQPDEHLTKPDTNQPTNTQFSEQTHTHTQRKKNQEEANRSKKRERSKSETRTESRSMDRSQNIHHQKVKPLRKTHAEKPVPHIKSQPETSKAPPGKPKQTPNIDIRCFLKPSITAKSKPIANSASSSKTKPIVMIKSKSKSPNDQVKTGSKTRNKLTKDRRPSTIFSNSLSTYVKSFDRNSRDQDP